MPQLSYNLESDAAFAGMKGDSRFDEVISLIAKGAIDFGLSLVRGQANPEKETRLPEANISTITDNAGTWTAADVKVTVNGTLVTETFDTDKDTSMTNLAASIQALAAVSTAVYSSGSHTIIITALDVAIIATVDLSAMTGNMTISGIVVTSNDVIRGIALHAHMDNRTLPTIGSSSYSATAYQDTDAVNCLRKGLAWVVTADAVVENADVYCIINGTDQGKFTDSSSSPNIQIPTAKFNKTVAAAGIAPVEINIP